MSARKRPVATGHARAPASSRRERLDQRLGDCSGRGRRDPTRPAAARGVAVERELADDERGAAGVEQRPVHRAGVVVEDAQVRDLGRELRGARPRRRRASRRRARRGPRRSRRRPRRRRVTRASVTRWTSARTRDGATTRPSRRSARVRARARPGRSCARGAGTRPGPRSCSRRRPSTPATPRACSARPYENDSCHGCGPFLLIASRFAVASSSPWPPDRNTMPGTAAGTTVAEARDRRVGDRLGRRRASSRDFFPGITMFGFSNMPSSSTRWSYSASKTVCSVSRRDLVATLDRVVAVHQHFGLDDRDDAFVLAQRGVTRERVRVHVEAVLRRDARADVDHRAPLRERAPSSRYSTSRARKPSRPSVTSSSGDSASGVVPLSTLMPGMMPCSSRIFGERAAVGGVLADRLVEQDHAADVVGRALRREQHLAVRAAAVLGRLAPDRVEALLDRAAALVGREDALARRDDCAAAFSASP